MFEISVVCLFATNPAAARDFAIFHNSQFFTILRRPSAKALGVVSDRHDYRTKSPIEIWQVGAVGCHTKWRQRRYFVAG